MEDISTEAVKCSECSNNLEVFLKFKSACDYMREVTSATDPEDDTSLHPEDFEITDKLLSMNEYKCCFCTKTNGRERLTSLNKSKEHRLLVDLLKEHIPKLNLSMTEELLTCDTCLRALQGVQSFVMKCLDVTQKISKYIIVIKGTDEEGRIKLNNEKQFTSEPTVTFEADSRGEIEINETSEQFQEECTMQTEAEIKHEEAIENPDLFIKTEDSDVASEHSDYDSSEDSPGGIRLVELPKLPDDDGDDNDAESDVESSITTDFDQDHICEMSQSSHTNQVAESIISSSGKSEQQSVSMPLEESSTFLTKDVQNRGDEKVQDWLSKDVNINCNEPTTHTDSLSGDDQMAVESVSYSLRNRETGEALRTEAQKLATIAKRRWKRKRTLCSFCKVEVTNFERHLERHHKNCKRVAEMLTHPKRSKERKKKIGILRNEGHFDLFLRGNIRPVYDSKIKSNKQYIPCINCKGLYSRKWISRHRKKCFSADMIKNYGRVKHVSASQTLIACALNGNNAVHNLRVRKEVFDIMKPDEISLIVKTDVLICHFGELCLKKYNNKHVSTVCSNKMRELARLLIEFRRVKNNESYKVVDMLDPVMFDTVRECAKTVAGYDPDKKTCRAPTLLARIGTSLKQASDLVISLVDMQDPVIQFNDLKIKMNNAKKFKDMICSQWMIDIISFDLKTETKWNKYIVLPLTKDILKFKEYVAEIATKAAAVLRENPNNKEEFTNLVDATLTLTILYNRVSIEDVQYVKLQTYVGKSPALNHDESLDSSSGSEEFLTKHYKRVITEGSSSTPIMVLFPQNLQEFIDVVINVRPLTDLVLANNPYLFAHPESKSWARGDEAIQKFAEEADLDYPKEISSNKLRKQIATIMQILNLTQEEMEQFALSVGYTEKTYDTLYKLPQDISQTERISELLIFMDESAEHKHEDKPLNKIEEAKPENSEKKECGEVDHTASTNEPVPQSPEPSTSVCAKPCGCKQSGRTAWTTEQAEAVTSYFKRHIRLKKPPRKHECEELIKKHPHLLRNKDWVRVKTYIYNTYRDR